VFTVPPTLQSFGEAVAQKFERPEWRALPTFVSAEADNPTPKTAFRSLELAVPTPSRRWHFSGRPAGPFWKRSFASQAAKSPPGDSGRSRVASTARYKHAAERLHLKAANRRCRPSAVLHHSSLSDWSTALPNTAGFRIHTDGMNERSRWQ
jgi:hypothetical protein